MPQPKTSRSSAAKKPAAKRPAAKAAAKPTPEPVEEKSAAEAQAERDEQLKEHLSSLRDILAGGIVLTAQSVQSVLDEAVENGRMLRRDAEDLARGLVEHGRQQRVELLEDIADALGVKRSDLELDLDSPTSAARSAAGAAKAVAKEAGGKVKRGADTARRKARLPPG